MEGSFALIGAGVMGQNHIRALKLLDTNVVAVVESGEALHKIPEDIPVFPRVGQLVDRGIEAAVVATPTATHEEVTRELAAMGINVLVEKPIAHSLKAARAMVEHVSSRGLVGAVGHIERYNPAIAQLRMRVTRGDIGRVYQVATRRQGSFPSRISDVGVCKDLATHDIDVVSWVLGSSYAHVYAEFAQESGRAHEDLLFATGKLQNGVLVNHVVNWLSPMKERTVAVTGELGTLVADTVMGDLTLHQNGRDSVDWESLATFRGVTEGDVTRFAFPRREPLLAELESFKDAVFRSGTDYVSFEEGLTILGVAEAMIRSAASGKREILT